MPPRVEEPEQWVPAVRGNDGGGWGSFVHHRTFSQDSLPLPTGPSSPGEARSAKTTGTHAMLQHAAASRGSPRSPLRGVRG